MTLLSRYRIARRQGYWSRLWCLSWALRGGTLRCRDRTGRIIGWIEWKRS